MSTAIAVKNLRHAYGNLEIIKNISFSVKQGQFFIIIGPNGSGKTTLMKAISGIINCEAEVLDIEGAGIHTYSRKSLARTLAMVPQMASADFPFSVQETVLMGRSPHLGLLALEQRKDMDIARQAMEFTGILHLAHRKLNQLSGGEHQRVLIARALCQAPQIILLDEPTAALDLAHQVRIMDLMNRLTTKKGLTVVMISHDVNLAAMYGNELLLLKNGEIVCQGPPAEVLNYQTLEAAYGCTLLVDQSPLGKFPRITLVPEKHKL